MEFFGGVEAEGVGEAGGEVVGSLGKGGKGGEEGDEDDGVFFTVEGRLSAVEGEN